MSCKIKNIVWLITLLLLVAGTRSALAQGAVSLSDEAMFDDELETTKDFPNDNSAVAESSEQDKSDTATTVDNNDAAEDIVEEEATATEEEKVDTAPVKNEVSANDMPVLAVTSKKEETPAAENLAKIEAIVNENSEKTKVDDLFSQMSDIEKSTTLLNLELRREKLQNEIEAVRNQRKQAAEQERLKAEELKQKQLEKEREEERKKREEEQRLRELDIQFEKLRQEKILKAYKNQMLEETQKWIAHDAVFHKTIADLREERKILTEGYKNKLVSLKNESDDAYQAYQNRMKEHENEVQNLNSQIDVLRNRIVSLEQELEEKSQTMLPGAGGASAEPGAGVAPGGSTESGLTISNVGDAITPLSRHYAIIEIRGKGGELVAKLLNRNGLTFYVKKGTALQSGHVVSEITSTYVAADKNFKRDYIYLSSGGILPQEIDAFEVDKASDK